MTLGCEESSFSCSVFVMSSSSWPDLIVRIHRVVEVVAVKRVKPAAVVIARATGSLKPRVPRPAPSGCDRLDDMQLSTEKPYSIAAIGFFARFSSKRRLGVDVGDQPGAVGLQRRRMLRMTPRGGSCRECNRRW